MKNLKEGTKVLICGKHDSFNEEGRMDEWIGKIMTVRHNGGKFYRMEEDIDSWNRGWYWHESVVSPISELDCIKDTNITVEDFLSEYCKIKGKIE